MNLRNIMLNERSQIQETIYCTILFIGNSTNGKTGDRKQNRGWLRWGNGINVKGHKGSFGGDRNVV